MKKFAFLTLCFFALCLLFHKQVLGAAAKFALKTQCNCDLVYGGLDWENGALVFSDVIVFDSTFHTHLPKAYLQVDWRSLPKKLKGRLLIEDPHVSVIKPRSFPKMDSGWLELSVSVQRGTLDWDGRVHFSLDHTDTSSQLVLKWIDSNLMLSYQDGILEIEAEKFKAPLLKPWIPFTEIAKGQFTGRIAFDQKLRPLSASLKVDHLAALASLGSVEGVSGTVSYNATVGAKWDLQGLGTAQNKQFPFAFLGRGFFKSRWFESEIQFEQGKCKISGDQIWTLQCDQLRSEEATLLQAGVSAVWPDLGDWRFETGILSGKAAFSLDSWATEFEGKDLSLNKGHFSLVCQEAKGNLTQDGGTLALIGENYDFKAKGSWNLWTADASVWGTKTVLEGGWDGEKIPLRIANGTFNDFQFQGQGWVDLNLNLFFNLDGIWTVLNQKLPFYCPNLSKKEGLWDFDFRLARQTWDLLRLAGTFNGKEVFYSPKSHFLGAPLLFECSTFSDLDIQLKLPWDSVLSVAPLLNEWGLDLTKIPSLNETQIHFECKKGLTRILAQGNSPAFVFQAEQSKEEWHFDLESDLTLKAVLQKGGFAKGRGTWKKGCEIEFEGKLQPTARCEFALPKVRFDLAELKDSRIEGILEGQGHLIYNGQIEADFDLAASSLKIQSQAMENEGQIHVYYSSEGGALFRGLNLHGPFDCIVDLLQCDANQSRWIFHNAQIHLPGSLFSHRFLQFLDKERDLNFTANLDFASDFSSFVCTMREGSIPFKGNSHHIQDLRVSWRNSECKVALRYRDHLYRMHMHMNDGIAGRLILGEETIPLCIDWAYQDEFAIHAIEGSFGGVEASFHAESEDTLVGSARVNFTALSEFLPVDVAQVFQEIKMGKGYELKGRLKINQNTPHFQGILCGKQIELFGFQFRTLLAQVDLSPNKIRIYDTKISDSAGMMKIDELVLEGKKGFPWTIEIPTLCIQEFRPSLMQRPGEAIGPISPLVVRDLKITDFKGLVEEGKTYTAKGNLRFINSYKREETVFDLPANVLSRIVGLDLELLIPVTGDLEFELKDGFFVLTELKNAYSEGKRSEFFLEMNPPPTMDLEGNLNIFIKMKQFVLLKFTESFLISIEGQLDDPQFHLQKRRFFGLI